MLHEEKCDDEALDILERNGIKLRSHLDKSQVTPGRVLPTSQKQDTLAKEYVNGTTSIRVLAAWFILKTGNSEYTIFPESLC